MPNLGDVESLTAAWQNLSDELDLWQADGREVTLWLRDDDAVDDTPQLDKLLDLANSHAIPLSLAVIPVQATLGLIGLLQNQPKTITVLVHGLDHQNKAPEAEKKAEFSRHRPDSDMLEDLIEGRMILARDLTERALPVFVPPWNRIPAEILPKLPDCGFAGLSTYKARSPDKIPGLTINNCHVDLINWKAEKAFAGEAVTLDLLTSHLGARRTNQVDRSEITGILTHHLVQDAETWHFLENLFVWTTRQTTVRWLDAREVFKIS